MNKALLTLCLVFCLCSCKKTEEKKIEITKTEIVKDTIKTVRKEVKINLNRDISGHYKLVEGYTKFHEGNTDSIFKGVLNIKKVSSSDHEAIRVDKYHETTPLSDYTVIRDYKKSYYELSNCNKPVPAYYFQKKYLITKKTDSIIEIEEPMGNCDRFSVWKKIDTSETLHLSLRRTFSKAKVEYKNAYTDLITVNPEDVKIDIIYTNGLLKTKHKHKSEPNNTEVFTSY